MKFESIKLSQKADANNDSLEILNAKSVCFQQQQQHQKSKETYNTFNFLGDDIKMNNSFTADDFLTKVHIPKQFSMLCNNIFCTDDS